MEASFLEIKSKQVINTVDGKCLGHVTDIIFDVVCPTVLGFVVPGQSKGFLGMFRGAKDIFIPFNCVCKIGVDAVLVELYIDEKTGNPKGNPRNRGKTSVLTQDNQVQT